MGVIKRLDIIERIGKILKIVLHIICKIIQMTD